MAASSQAPATHADASTGGEKAVALVSPPVPASSGAVSAVPGGEAADFQATAGAPARPAATSADQKADLPSFDVVRVEPTGDSVIAARGKSGQDLILLDAGKEIARAKADANGQVALIPPPLPPGEHNLSLSVGEPGGSGAVSSQSVIVSVPSQAKTAPLVALLEPNQPAKVLSGPVAGGPSDSGKPSGAGSSPAASTPSEPKAAQAVAIRSVEAEEAGSFFVTGKAAPNSNCRVYLNGSFIATVAAGQDGNWSLKVKRGMKPGNYAVRVDQIEGSGAVTARSEVPFDYPAHLRAAGSLLRPHQTPKSTGIAAAAPQPATASPPVPLAAGGGSPTPSAPAGQSVQTAENGSSRSALTAGTTPQPVPNRAETGGPGTSTAAQVGTEAQPVPTVVAELLTTRVVRGDTLWRISKKVLGHGVRYTQIYAANTAQIRDPKWIYPGQIFVMPQSGTP